MTDLSSPKTVTRLLVEPWNGDQAALDKLMPLINNEPRWLAEGRMLDERHL